MIKVGQKVKFDPFAHITGYGVEAMRGNMLTGTVVMVNETHKLFFVEYGDPKAITAFKFCDIGTAVKVCG